VQRLDISFGASKNETCVVWQATDEHAQQQLELKQWRAKHPWLTEASKLDT
jgi:hypothetical protein